MDDLQYFYEDKKNPNNPSNRNTNKLISVDDAVGTSTYNDIKSGQVAVNYHYDQTGNLIKDIQEGIESIEWNVYGKISTITRTPGSNSADLEFQYDAMGHRVAKIVKPAGSTSATWTTTYYIRDAQGNILTTFKKNESNSSLYLSEHNIFGSSRLGLLSVNELTTNLDKGNYKSRLMGRKNYELSNHLGNVLSVVSDRKIAVSLNTTTVAYYLADIKSTTDYYAFGSEMPGRTFNSTDYRYGMNGMEKDDEIKGSGNSYDFGARIYDPRIGKWLSVDPLQTKYPSLSPYHSFGNSPIVVVDKDGKENVIYLVDLRLQDPKLSKADRATITKNLNEIANAANSGFKDKGLNQRVVVISPSQIPTADKLDKSDVLATIGTQSQLKQFDDARSNNSGSKNSGDYDLVGVGGMGSERSTIIGMYGGDEGNRIALNTDAIGSDAKKLGIGEIEYSAWLIQHGSGHNAGISHSDDLEPKLPTSGEPRDLMTSGEKAIGNPSAWRGYKDNVNSTLKSLFTKSKFTEKPAKDKIYNKKIDN
ncbi:MAG: hypothetical protein H0X62_06640 [Bacteroidetes bacterium]|nr:hypothetical protein [Bacteroidota bacterium]